MDGSGWIETVSSPTMTDQGFMLNDTLVGVIIGAFLGFAFTEASAYFRRLRERRNEKTKNTKLARLLYEEIEQVAELLEVDLQLPTHTPLSEVFNETHRQRDTYLAAIERAKSSNVMFEAYLDQLIALPNPIPNQLVRFHVRLSAHADQMAEAYVSGSTNTYQELRAVSLTEAKALKSELKSVFDK